MTSEDFDQRRLQDLADNISQEQELLKEYEDLLREETDPRLKRKYCRCIEEHKQSASRYLKEYDLQKERINRYKRILSDYSVPSQSNKLPPEHHSLLFDLLLKIDFKKQLHLAETAINNQQTIGFLVHGESNCGQEMLVNRLYRTKPTWQNHKPIRIDVKSNGAFANLSKLWERVAECFMDESERNNRQDINSVSNLVLERICNRLKTQDVIFIFSEVELMSYTETLIPWLEDFWQPLVEMAKTNEFLRSTHLLMFLVDNSGKVCQSGVTLAEKFEPVNYNPCIPLCLPPVSIFTAKMLQKWLDEHIKSSSNLGMLAELKAKDLYENSDSGIPINVAGIICAYYGLSWEVESAKWSI